MPKLICLSGMNKGDEYDLPDGGEITIGRSEKNDICVFDKKSSRRHCKIYINSDKFAIEDLESTNGLRVNNVFVTDSQPVKVGDHIRIGQTVFLIGEQTVNAIDKDNETPSSIIRKQKKYENLLQKTAFQVTKTTALRKLKTEQEGKETGFLSFFERED